MPYTWYNWEEENSNDIIVMGHNPQKTIMIHEQIYPDQRKKIRCSGLVLFRTKELTEPTRATEHTEPLNSESWLLLKPGFNQKWFR